MSPTKPMSPCRYPRCAALAVPGSAYCLTHRREKGRERGTSKEQGYDNRWRKARRAYLNANPLCVECKGEGRVEAATIVDHIIPHRGDYELMWDSEGNYQSLCTYHHQVKSNEERAARVY